MPLTYDEITDNLVTIRANGMVTNEDHRIVFEQITKDVNFRNGCKVLLYDKGGRYSPTMQEAMELVLIIKQFQNERFSRFAVIVTSMFHWSVGRLLAAYAKAQKRISVYSVMNKSRKRGCLKKAKRNIA
ncbi:MAG: hypothetical protein ABIA59_02660 [Candidatus Latescibacterota bacterium]